VNAYRADPKDLTLMGVSGEHFKAPQLDRRGRLKYDFKCDK
jgi:hypothetical protein